MRGTTKRPDRSGAHEAIYRKNRALVMKMSNVCGICGRPIDPELKFPDPMSASLDHIVPISLGGHPYAQSNMQVAHLICNRTKGAKLQTDSRPDPRLPAPHNNRDLKWSRNWREYKPDRDE